MSRDNDRVSEHKTRDLIPGEFASVEDAAEFWGTHDLTDYEDQTREADFYVDLRCIHISSGSPSRHYSVLG